MKRLTISVDDDDYQKLKSIAKQRKPKLSMQYVVEYAIQEFLSKADDARLTPRVGNPIQNQRGERS